MVDARSASPPHVTAAAALGSLAAARSVVGELERRGIPVMVLKGPPLQRRLFGTDCAYESADIDLLVLAGAARSVRRLLRSQGWQFFTGNGVLWWLDRAAAFTRDGVTIDLHWGIHAYTLGPRRLRPLEAALWDGATRSTEGWWEPLPESLVVYLAVNWAGHQYQGRQRLASVRAAAAMVTDWDRVHAIARDSGVSALVDHAMAADPEHEGEGPSLVNGRMRTAAVGMLTWARTRTPARVRRAVRRVRGRA